MELETKQKSFSDISDKAIDLSMLERFYSGRISMKMFVAHREPSGVNST